MAHGTGNAGQAITGDAVLLQFTWAQPAWKSTLCINNYAMRHAQELDMNKTLEENGVQDETESFEDLHIATDTFVPVLHMYWNDDLTVA